MEIWLCQEMDRGCQGSLRQLLNSTTATHRMDKVEKRNRALGLFVESVLKPDHELRQCAHNQKCYNELLEWRQEVLDYLNSRRKEEFGQ